MSIHILKHIYPQALRTVAWHVISSVYLLTPYKTSEMQFLKILS